MNALLCAGGTGGHLFPAQALAAVLHAREHKVHLITDARAKPFLDTFPADSVHLVGAATLAGRSVGAAVKMLATNSIGLARALFILKRTKADIAIGFGGYPTLAPLLAARVLKVPAIVHEANAVMGRANRFLAGKAHVATSFPSVRGIPESARTITQVGMPVRQAVLDAAAPYGLPHERLNLLVFGGSQGARVFADLVPPALAALPEEVQRRIALTQQVRQEDMERVKAVYGASHIDATLAPFFRDLPEKMAASHLVIARSGASTVMELAVMGRPSLLVPLPGALDQDQAHNATALDAIGGAKRLDQAGLTPDKIGAEISALMAAPERLSTMAASAKGLARPRAAQELADLAERFGGAIGFTEIEGETRS
ncbi:MAG: UDP-N-acetylglucosamine--N-acetylmuramyl-(pentapeptide) pyrophosphoryl-undecaprenol N-acetylglucosamine transferase [Pseudomonadota bacterium]